jgi:hypothetical protein
MMEQQTPSHVRSEARTSEDSPRRHGRRRRVRVRVVTDVETYLASLQVPHRRGGLDHVLNDGRAYLALWDATLAGSSEVEEFVAIHKGAIRSIVVLEPPGTRAPASALASVES